MIRVSEPFIPKNAQKYINQCLSSGWVSSSGPFIKKFESKFAKYIGTKFAVTTTSGTTALHLALASLGIGKGDEVILPDLTMMACPLAVIYTGAKPVFVDVEAKTGNIDPGLIEEKITKKTKAIMVVHLFGQSADLDPIIKIAKKYRLKIIEDTAESLGSEYLGKKAGSIGDLGCFSFYANKLITTGEGGMVVTNSKTLYQKLKFLNNLAHDPKKRFLHKEIGFNYRMTNLQAALGLAQLEEIKNFIKKKQEITRLYNQGLKDNPNFEIAPQLPGTKKVTWMYTLLTKNADREKVTSYLKQKDIETRNFFIPLHSQPALKNITDKNQQYPVSDDLSKRGFYIPSGLNLTTNQMKYIIKTLNSYK